MAKLAGSDLVSGHDTSIGAIATDLSSEVWNSSGTFTRSAVYTGIAEPILGVAQIVDKATGTQLMPSAEATLSSIGISEPEQATGGFDRHAQMLGHAVGMMLPYLLLHKAVRTGASSAFGAETFAMQGNLATMSAGMTGRLAATEASLGFATGFVNDSVFRHSSGNLNGTSFVADRLLNGIAGGATMATLTGSSIGLTRLGASEALKSSILKTVLSSPVGTGVLSAVPSGLVSAEAQALRQGKLAPTAAEASDHIYQMAFVGGALGAAHKFRFDGKNEASKYQDITTTLRTGSIESMETPAQRAKRLELPADMEQSKELVFAKIRGRDGNVSDVVIRPLGEDAGSIMRIARAEVTGRVNETLQSMAGIPSSALPLILRDNISLPLTDSQYNVTMREPGPVIVQENGGKQLGSQIREWASQSSGVEKTIDAPTGSITQLVNENADVRAVVGRAAFDSLYKGNIDFVEFSQQTLPDGTIGKDLAPSKSLRIVSIDNKNDFTLVESPTWGFGSQFGLSLEVAKALEGKRLGEASPELQTDAEAMLRVFGSKEGANRLLRDGLSTQEIDAAHKRLTSLVHEGFPTHLGETNFYTDAVNQKGLTASLTTKYDTESEIVQRYLRARDRNLVLIKNDGPLRIERVTNPDAIPGTNQNATSGTTQNAIQGATPGTNPDAPATGEPIAKSN